VIPSFPEAAGEVLSVHVEPDRDVVVVTPVGEIDMATAPQLATAVGELRAAGFRAFRIDLRRVTFLDSSGLRCLLELSAARAEGLRLTFVPGSPAVQRVVDLTCSGELLAFEPAPAPPVRRPPTITQRLRQAPSRGRRVQA
jgi:anti-anti-sigma factor